MISLKGPHWYLMDFQNLSLNLTKRMKMVIWLLIVEYKTQELLENPKITFFNGIIEESKKYTALIYPDKKHLVFTYPDNDNNKSQIFKIELCESHDKTLQKMRNESLCYEYLTEEQLNEYKEGLSNIKQQVQIDSSNVQIDNNKIPLKINCHMKNVNAFLLNDKFHSLDDKNDKIYLYKNKKYKIEPVYYDAEKQKFYHLPKSNVYEFGPSDLCNIGKLDLIIDNYDASVPTFTSSPETSIPIGLTKPINHEKSSNLELGFGIPLALSAIGFAFALAFGVLPAIIALPFIIGLGISGGGLIVKGSYDKHYTLNKSQEPGTEYSDEVTQDIDIEDPIWASSKSNSQDSIDGDKPLFEASDDDIFQNNGEEDWFEHII